MVNDIPFVTTDELWLPLDDYEVLSVGMNWYDLDHFSDDRQCEGEYVFSFMDLNEIAAQPNRRMTINKYFNERGGGSCGMQFTISVLQETPPSDE